MTLLASVSLAVAAVAAPASAPDHVAIAREALRDGLWEVARRHAAAVTNDEARLVTLESFAAEGRWKEVANALAEMSACRGAAFDYYRALAAGDVAAAMKTMSASSNAAVRAETKLYEAELLKKAGRRDAAAKAYRELAASSNLSDRVIASVAANLGEEPVLRRAYAQVEDTELRRTLGLRLGTACLAATNTFAEGEKLIRSIVRDAPDTDGAREAMLALADSELAAHRWQRAADAFRETTDAWPDTARLASVAEGRGWALFNLKRHSEAMDAFVQAEAAATGDDAKATAMMKQGDVLTALGRNEEAMAKYRDVIQKFPKAGVTTRLKRLVHLRELETRGRECYRSYDFEGARLAFAEIAEADSERAPRMEFYRALCLYGEGRDAEAVAAALRLTEASRDPAVAADATLWLAKFRYNRREWKASRALFDTYAKLADGEPAAEALLWSARAAYAEGDCSLAATTVAKLIERFPASAHKAEALLVQGEALFELARFEEAVLVLDRIAGDDVTAKVRLRARIVRADAIFAIGADNPHRYDMALKAYESIAFDGVSTADERLVIAFKIARTLEKLKRLDEAIDRYYTEVVLAYRNGRDSGERYGDEARAAFSRAAFWLADEFESRGLDRQAKAVLSLVVTSDVPAAAEATRRLKRISDKGRFL